MPAITHSLNQFRGLDERMQIGSSFQTTTSLDNVIVRNGNVLGRKGLALWDGISTAAGNIVTDLADFYVPSSATSTLLRLTKNKLESWNSSTHAWDDITGVALSGTDTDRPCFASMSDEGFVVFTNEGHDRPRKYDGTGTSVVLGGAPPYAKWLEPFKGFLFLFNTSVSGAFDVLADSITAYFSDVPDGDWAPCEANTIVFDESPGELRAAKTYGQNLIVYKADCIVQVRFVGGLVKFSRQKLNFNLGLLAPKSLQGIGEFGQIFLASDCNLYRTDGNQVVPLSLNVQRSLQETMTKAKAPFARGYVDLSHETYHLLYQRNSATYFDGRLSYNYRTGEFYRGVHTGYELSAALGYRTSNNVATQLVIANSSDKKVYEEENGTDDAGTRISRYYDLDWSQFGTPGSKYLTGANLVFTHSTNTQVRISVAADHSHIFQFPRMYSLKGKFPSDPNVRVKYELPSPIYGSWLKFRVELFHYGSTGVVELQEIEPIVIPVSQVPSDESKQPYAQRA